MGGDYTDILFLSVIYLEINKTQNIYINPNQTYLSMKITNLILNILNICFTRDDAPNFFYNVYRYKIFITLFIYIFGRRKTFKIITINIFYRLKSI